MPLDFFKGIGSLGSTGAGDCCLLLVGSLFVAGVVTIAPGVAVWLAVPRFWGNSPRLERLGRLAPLGKDLPADRSRVRSEESQ